MRDSHGWNRKINYGEVDSSLFFVFSWFQKRIEKTKIKDKRFGGSTFSLRRFEVSNW